MSHPQVPRVVNDLVSVFYPGRFNAEWSLWLSHIFWVLSGMARDLLPQPPTCALWPRFPSIIFSGNPRSGLLWEHCSARSAHGTHQWVQMWRLTAGPCQPLRWIWPFKWGPCHPGPLGDPLRGTPFGSCLCSRDNNPLKGECAHFTQDHYCIILQLILM